MYQSQAWRSKAEEKHQYFWLSNLMSEYPYLRGSFVHAKNDTNNEGDELCKHQTEVGSC
jgi:hypothetical protein